MYDDVDCCILLLASVRARQIAQSVSLKLAMRSLKLPVQVQFAQTASLSCYVCHDQRLLYDRKSCLRQCISY